MLVLSTFSPFPQLLTLFLFMYPFLIPSLHYFFSFLVLLLKSLSFSVNPHSFHFLSLTVFHRHLPLLISFSIPFFLFFLLPLFKSLSFISFSAYSFLFFSSLFSSSSSSYLILFTIFPLCSSPFF